MATEFIEQVDLRALAPIRSKEKTYTFRDAVRWDHASRFMLIRYSVNGKPEELGLRMDMDKQVFLDDFGDAKATVTQRGKTRKAKTALETKAPLIWKRIADHRRAQSAALAAG